MPIHSLTTRALLVDDDEKDALLIRVQLAESTQGAFDLVHVETVRDAMNRLAVEPTIDLVLLDLMLPDAEGMEGLAQLRVHFPDIPIVMLTGLNDESMAIRSLRMGAQDYLAKGHFDHHLLTRAIRYALERKAAEVERNRLHLELARRERLAAVGQTVTSVMHYIKNVLTRMVSSERLIDQMLEYGNSDRLKEVWPILRRATDDLNHYVKGMLDYSRDQQIDFAPNHLNELATRIHGICLEDAERLGITLELALDEHVPQTWYDDSLISDAALNLVTNALEAVSGATNPRVTIATRFLPETGRVQFCAIDNGYGIPEHMRDKVFDPFFTTKGAKGTGLGLAMAQKNVIAHHGRIIAESAPGKTEFCIALPLEQPQSQAIAS